jgi:hypothetical protein
MHAAIRGCEVFDRYFNASAPVLTCEYSFGPGSAKVLAVDGASGLIVISPPCRVALWSHRMPFSFSSGTTAA